MTGCPPGGGEPVCLQDYSGVITVLKKLYDDSDETRRCRLSTKWLRSVGRDVSFSVRTSEIREEYEVLNRDIIFTSTALTVLQLHPLAS